MDCLEFLRLVWPEQGPYITAFPIKWVYKATGEEVKGFKHFTHEDIESAAQWCQDIAWDREAGRDVFFGLGSLRDAEGVPHRTKPGKLQLRVQRNIKELKAFWVDLDVDPADHKKYPSKQQAMLHIAQFVVAQGLPKPLVVDSGGGIHVYWPLTAPLPADEWEGYARLLKGALASYGVKQDPTRTADCASVLRPVDTANWKTGDARQVTARNEIDPIDTEHMKVAIKRVGVEPAGAKPSAPKAAVSKLGTVPEHLRGANAAINTAARPETAADRPSNPEKILARCRQIGWQRDNPDQVSEPQWYDMIGCLRHTDGGEEVIHRLSAHYEGYTEEVTQNKIEQHRENDIGPTLCSTFNDHNPGVCEGCPHYGKVKSPIVLGFEQEEAQAPKLQLEMPSGEIEEIQLPEPSPPYRRVINPDNGIARIVMEFINPATEDLEEIEIYDYDVYPSRWVFDERESRYVATMRRWLPHEGWGEVEVPLGDFFDRKKLAILMGNFGLLPQSSNIEKLVDYMIGYIKNLQRMTSAQTVYAQLGWRDDNRFILPDQVVSETGSAPVAVSKNIKNALQWQAPKGDVETWKQVASMYTRPGLEPLLFGILTSFAAPLLHFTAFDGYLVNMRGEKGSGKTSAMYVANAIWGHKKSHWVDLQNDTKNAFYNKLAVLGNLPAFYDETTNLRHDNISELNYTLTKGTGRQRLNADASAKEAFVNWCLPLIGTSNASLQQLSLMSKADATAEASRIFEVLVPNGTLTKREADESLALLNDNYGMVGPLFVQALIKNLPAIMEQVKLRIREVDETAGTGSSERFWSAAAALALVAADVVNKMGLMEIDTKRLLAYLVRNIKRMRRLFDENVQTSNSLLNEYLSQNLRSVLAIGREPEKGKPAFVRTLPQSELRIRLEEWHHKLFIDRSHFRRFCADHNADASDVINEMKTNGACNKQDQRIVLSKGTTLKSTQVWCLVFDTEHDLLGGVEELAVSEDSNVVEFQR